MEVGSTNNRESAIGSSNMLKSIRFIKDALHSFNKVALRFTTFSNPKAQGLATSYVAVRYGASMLLKISFLDGVDTQTNNSTSVLGIMLNSASHMDTPTRYQIYAKILINCTTGSRKSHKDV